MAKQKNNDIVVIGDTQVKPDVPLDHLYALARYIWKHRPKHVVHIGDHWDFESLSSYASLLEREGRRLKDDLISGAQALDIIRDFLIEKNEKARSSKHRTYWPEMNFMMGNHEDRLDRFINAHPELHGFIDLEAMIVRAGWHVHPFTEPFWIDDVAFVHYLSNPMSGRAVGGSIENKLNKFPHCFVHGHQQQYQFGRRQNMRGQPHFGACCGAFYLHDEDYKGPNNTEIRGFIHLKAFTNRFGYNDYDVDFVSIERLLENY